MKRGLAKFDAAFFIFYAVEFVIEIEPPRCRESTLVRRKRKKNMTTIIKRKTATETKQEREEEREMKLRCAIS